MKWCAAVAKWCAAVALVLALVVKFAWHSDIDLGFPVNSTTDIGYPLSTVVFWLLLAIALFCLLVYLMGYLIMTRRVAPVSQGSYQVEGAPGPSLLGTGDGGLASSRKSIPYPA